MLKKISQLTTLNATALLLLFTALLLIGCGSLDRSAEPTEPQFETVRVERDTIASTVSATGSIEPDEQISLAFGTSGRISNVYVSIGETVAAGQLLAEIDTTDLTLALAQSRVTLEINEAQLAKLETPPKTNDIAAAQAAVQVAQAAVAAAEASLNSSQAAYGQLLASSSSAQQTVNEANVRSAEATLKTAQQAYNQVRSRPNIGALPQSAELERATIAFEAAKAQAELTNQGPDQSQIAAALSQIAQADSGLRQSQSSLITAQNNLQTLLDGADTNDLVIARAQVRQAQLNVVQAEKNLDNAQIIAPFDGIVTQVNVRANELSSGGSAFTLTNPNRFHMDVLVDEIDVRQLQIGQPVRISIDALPNTEVTGMVTQIATTADNVSGVIAYQVTIVPEFTDEALRAGMSATAIITTAQVNNVLLLPNRFIQLDRETGRAYVSKLRQTVVDGVTTSEPLLQEIELGLRNDNVSQIVAGLTDGDEIALIRISSEDRLRGALFGGPDG